MEALTIHTQFDGPVSFATSVSEAIRTTEKRLGRKAWLTWAGTVNGKHVELKTYSRSYPQILNVDGIRHGGAMDLRPTAFMDLLVKATS